MISPPSPSDDPYEGFQEVSARLMEIYGYYPSPGDRHVAEFFPFFLRQTENGLDYGTQSGLDMTNRTLASRDERWDRIAAQAEGRAELDRRLFDEAREGERVVSIMEAIVTDRPLVELAVNVRNDGLISNLPAEAVVEVPGLIDGRGVHGVPVGALPEGIAGILNARVRQQELTVDAALSGDRALALQALLADPLVPPSSRRQHARPGPAGPRSVLAAFRRNYFVCLTSAGEHIVIGYLSSQLRTMSLRRAVQLSSPSHRERVGVRVNAEIRSSPMDHID